MDKIWWPYCFVLFLFLFLSAEKWLIFNKNANPKDSFCLLLVFSTSHFLTVTPLILINIHILKPSCHSWIVLSWFTFAWFILKNNVNTFEWKLSLLNFNIKFSCPTNQLNSWPKKYPILNNLKISLCFD